VFRQGRPSHKVGCAGVVALDQAALEREVEETQVGMINIKQREERKK